MRNQLRSLPFLSLFLLAACGDDDRAHAAERNTGAATSPSARDESAPTAMDQSNAKADLDHLAEIRQAIVADDSLSTSGKNVTVLTRVGQVTLRGKVTSTQEKARIEEHAKSCAATRSVDNQIVVEMK